MGNGRVNEKIEKRRRTTFIFSDQLDDLLSLSFFAAALTLLSFTLKNYFLKNWKWANHRETAVPAFLPPSSLPLAAGAGAGVGDVTAAAATT